MPEPDFYSILGVSRSATADEIRAAYRNLARKLHPDVNKSSDAEARFKQVQEAYDVLSDEGKRAQYDRFGRVGAAPPGSSGRPRTTPDMDLDDLGEMFSAFFGGTPSGGPGFGGKRAKSARGRARPKAEPVDLHITFLTMAKGGPQPLSIETPSGLRRIEVMIPKGVADGALLRVRGDGWGDGDTTVRVRVGAHPAFRRTSPTGLDLELDLPLTLAEAALGAGVQIDTLSGMVELVVPPGTSSGRRLRLRGRGLEDAQGRTGDLLAQVRIVAPERLTEQQRALFERLGPLLPTPRRGEPWREGRQGENGAFA
ncbi:MAG: DnaJ domain-containing protein [Phycisphaerales bacterium]|nr:DnaJ domain-containing protein [Phycisphaerales bacterium]